MSRFLFLLVSVVGCDFCLWLFLDFLCTFFFKSDPLSSLRFNPSACSERVQQCLIISWVNPEVYEPRHEKPVFGSYRPGQIQTPAQLQKLARGLKFWLQKLDITLSRQRTTKTLIRLRMRRLICALVVRI